MTDTDFWQKRLTREKAARQEAEDLLERKSTELFQTNQNLAEARNRLEDEVKVRTRELRDTVDKLETEILKRKEVENRLRLSRDDAIQTADLKSQFLARMSHEIRTPLNAIIGLTDTVLRSELTDSQQQQLGIVGSSGRMLLKIVNDILDLSKLDANKLLIEYQEASITELIDQSVSVVANSAAEKGIKIREITGQNTPDTIIADKTRLQQILLNLLSNAIKYSDTGTIKIAASIDRGKPPALKLPEELSALRSSEHAQSYVLQIVVEDQGKGIAEKDQQAIFDPFSQLQETSDGSTGLGLSICQRLCDLMGGEIEIQSALGQGARFTVSVPCLLASDSSFARNQQEYSIRDTSFNKSPAQAESIESIVSGDSDSTALSRMGREHPLSILIADDNEINRIVCQVQLEELGYRADMVTNGEEVLRALHARQYDVLLLDILMPVLDGIETTRRIKLLEPERQPYIVAVTASALPEDRERFIAAGINDYLAKPVILTELADKLRTAYLRKSKVEARPETATADTTSPHAVVHLDELRSRLGKTANELLRRVIPVFVREMPGRQRTLREAHSNHDPVTFARLCHSLKGSCRSIGADPLAQECERLEQISYGGELPSANEFEAFVILSDETVQALSDELKLLESSFSH